MREMKDSGIGWIGFIPKEWDIHPVYYYFHEGKKRNYRCQEQNLLSLSYGKVKRKDINTSEGLLPASFNTYNIVKKGDIIIRPTDLQNDKRSLRTGLVLEQGIITSAYLDLVPRNKKIESRYFHYLLHSYDVMKVFYNMGNGVRQGLNYDEFSKLLLLSPSNCEQKAIADFLDNECAKIDEIMADVQSQIDALEDYKKSVISEAVTKGLNPDVEMKDSGIKWVGKIPFNWSINKIKYLLQERIEMNFPIKTFDILSLTAKQGVIPLNEKEGGGNKPKEDVTKYRLAYPGDIVMNSMNILSGSVGLSKYFGCVSPVYYMLRPYNSGYDVRFFNYLFQTTVFQKSLYGLGNGILMKESSNGKLNTIRMRISMDTFGALLLPVATEGEQKEISDYLDKKCADIDSVISDKKSQLETLEEYKKSLIYEYVTGKKEVPAVYEL